MTDLSRSFIEFEHRFAGGAAGAQYHRTVGRLGFDCASRFESKVWWFCDRSLLIENDSTRSLP
jgi:hypothetical protein